MSPTRSTIPQAWIIRTATRATSAGSPRQVGLGPDRRERPPVDLRAVAFVLHQALLAAATASPSPDPARGDSRPRRPASPVHRRYAVAGPGRLDPHVRPGRAAAPAGAPDPVHRQPVDDRAAARRRPPARRPATSRTRAARRTRSPRPTGESASTASPASASAAQPPLRRLRRQIRHHDPTARRDDQPVGPRQNPQLYAGEPPQRHHARDRAPGPSGCATIPTSAAPVRRPTRRPPVTSTGRRAWRPTRAATRAGPSGSSAEPPRRRGRAARARPGRRARRPAGRVRRARWHAHARVEPGQDERIAAGRDATRASASAGGQQPRRRARTASVGTSARTASGSRPRRRPACVAPTANRKRPGRPASAGSAHRARVECADQSRGGSRAGQRRRDDVADHLVGLATAAGRPPSGGPPAPPGRRPVERPELDVRPGGQLQAAVTAALRRVAASTRELRRRSACRRAAGPAPAAPSAAACSRSAPGHASDVGLPDRAQARPGYYGGRPTRPHPRVGIVTPLPRLDARWPGPEGWRPRAATPRRKPVRVRRGPATVTGRLERPGARNSGRRHSVLTRGADPEGSARVPAAVDLRHRPAQRPGQRLAPGAWPTRPAPPSTTCPPCSTASTWSWCASSAAAGPGRRASTRCWPAPVPVVVLGGEQAPDAELMKLSTVPAGVAAEAHALPGPRRLRPTWPRCTTSSPTRCCSPATASPPPAARPDWGVLLAARRPATGRRADGRASSTTGRTTWPGNTAFVEALCQAIEDEGRAGRCRSSPPPCVRRRPSCSPRCARPTPWS